MRISSRVGLATLTVLALSLALMVSAAGAAEVSIAGFTNGCYGAACTPATTNAPASVTLLGLTYTNSTFSGTTAGGFIAFGNAPGTPNVDNLGSFTLNGTPANYNGQSFTLRVTFTAPPGITGGNSRTFSALLTGVVTAIDNGAVSIDFNNTPTTFTFSFVNAQGQTVTGSFNFVVNDLAIGAGQTGALTGSVSSAQQEVPTAATLRSFGASRSHPGVLVRWRTASEAQTLGFNVYRQVSGNRVRVSRRMIPARNAAAGHRYTYLDRKAPRTKSPRYWLEVVNLDGSRNWLGPVRVTRS